jgi:hypothetical protein
MSSAYTHAQSWIVSDMYPESVLNYAINGSKYLASRPGPLDREPLKMRLMRPNGPHGQSWCFGEEKDLLPLPEFERQFLGSAARSIGTILTELTRVSVRGFSARMCFTNRLKKKHDRLKEASWSQWLTVRILKWQILRQSELVASSYQNHATDENYVMRNAVTCVQLTWLDSRHRDRTKPIRSAPGR